MKNTRERNNQKIINSSLKPKKYLGWQKTYELGQRLFNHTRYFEKASEMGQFELGQINKGVSQSNTGQYTGSNLCFILQIVHVKTIARVGALVNFFVPTQNRLV